ncbi:MAG: SPOR domain-containing protein [Candidatus Omnitrophica bacterium]|nr:SPOR domain-containing protein [Candidatus Omnitrophota bacterium]
MRTFIVICIVFIMGFFCGRFSTTQDFRLPTRMPSFSKITDLMESSPKTVQDNKMTADEVMVQQGVKESNAPVVKKQTVTPQAKTVEKPVSQRIYTVQVASFKDLPDARKYVSQLIDKQFDAYIAPMDIGENKGWYRVCIGETTSLSHAKENLQKLQPTFKDSFIRYF